MSDSISIPDATSGDAPSTWQQSIEGEWHGRPTIFDAEGNVVGLNKVYRSSVFEDGQTTYYMDTRLEASGPLRSRFEATTFAFRVVDSDQNRIYLGPDFVGAGHPYGPQLVDAHYYSPGWTADLRTMVHILDDHETQVYSSLLYDGPTICGVFNGIYKVAFDYHTNPDTKARIDAFCEAEAANGQKPHVLPMKDAGAWTGTLQLYGADQKPAGEVHVRTEYRPLTLLRAECETTITGDVEHTFRYTRHRNGHRHFYEGPDMFGNAIGYGRALYTSQHLTGKATKIAGRDFLIDDDFTMSVVWKLSDGDALSHVAFGVLTWTPS